MQQKSKRPNDQDKPAGKDFLPYIPRITDRSGNYYKKKTLKLYTNQPEKFKNFKDRRKTKGIFSQRRHLSNTIQLRECIHWNNKTV